MTPKFPWLSVLLDLVLTLYLMYSFIFLPATMTPFWAAFSVLLIFLNGFTIGRHCMRHKALKVLPGVLKEFEKALKS